jgi:hypothetical protein
MLSGQTRLAAFNLTAFVKRVMELSAATVRLV